MNGPRWKSNPILATKIAPYDGECSYPTWQKHVAATRQNKLLELFTHYGLSPDSLDDALGLIAELTMDHVDGFQIAIPPSRKVDEKTTIEDAILLGAIKVAQEKNPRVNVTGIIRDLAKWNNWPSDKASIETKRNRFYALDREGSSERRNLGLFLSKIALDLQAHLAQLDKKSKI